MQPKKSSFSSLSNEPLCKLGDEIAALLNSRAEELRKELALLTNGADGKTDNAKRKSAAPKYCGPNGDTWTGRGKRPRWLTAALAEGKKLEDFLIALDGSSQARSD